MKKFYSNTEAYSFLEKQVQNDQVFSFDIFDTLLHRHIAPDVVIDGICNWIKKISNDESLELKKDPHEARHEAYVKVAERREKAGLDFEVDYQQFCFYWCQVCFGNDFPECLPKRLAEKELELELAVVHVNLDALNFIESLYDRNIKVLLISDMYLSKDSIESLLVSLGYDLKWFSSIYVSSECGFLKRTGNIFDYVLEQEALNASVLHHVGDNFESDGTRPQEKGINSYIVRDRVQFLLNKESERDLQLSRQKSEYLGVCSYKYANRKMRINGDGAAGVLGPVLSSYMHSAIDYCVKNNIDDVYFMSREGAVLKVVFDTILRTLAPNSGINSRYLYTSRVSSFRANCVAGITLKQLQNCIRNTSNYTVASILAPFSISKTILDKKCYEYGIRGCDSVLPAAFETWEPFLNLVSDKDINCIVRDMGAMQNSLLVDYMKQIGFFRGKKVALIDVGWSGQIQDNIYQALEMAGEDIPEIHGLYLGCRTTAHERVRPKSKYIWFSADESHAGWFGTSTLESVFPMETLTRAPHATVVGYKRNGSDVEVEFKCNDSPSRVKERSVDALISKYQRNAIIYSEHYADFCRLYNIGAYLTLPFSRVALDQLVRFPPSELAKEFVTIQNISDLGSNDSHYVAGYYTTIAQFLNNRNNHLWQYAGMSSLSSLFKLSWVSYRTAKIRGKDSAIPRVPNQRKYGYIIEKVAEEGIGTREATQCIDMDFSNDVEYLQLKDMIYDSAGGEVLTEDSEFSFTNAKLSLYAMKLSNLIRKLRKKHQYYNDGIAFKLISSAAVGADK